MNTLPLIFDFNRLSANPTNWSNTFKQFVGADNSRLLPTNCLSVFDQLVGLALKGLNNYSLVCIDVILCNFFFSSRSH